EARECIRECDVGFTRRGGLVAAAFVKGDKVTLAQGITPILWVGCTPPAPRPRLPVLAGAFSSKRQPEPVRPLAEACEGAMHLARRVGIAERQHVRVLHQIEYSVRRNRTAKIRSGDVFQFMGFIEYYRRIVRQHCAEVSAAQSQVGEKEMMVDDDD